MEQPRKGLEMSGVERKSPIDPYLKACNYVHEVLKIRSQRITFSHF